MELCLIFLSYLTFIVNGVFGGEVKSVSVMEGHSVTLHTDTIRQRDDLTWWYYGPEKTVVARINGEANSIKLSEDEMFIDRVKMNHQTGDLIISDVKSNHSGLYILNINRNWKVSNKTFNLTVNDPDNTQLNIKSSESPDQRLIVITPVVVSVLCVIIIIIIIISVYMKKRKVKSSESVKLQTVEMRSISSSSTCEDEESSKCLMKNKNTELEQDQCKHVAQTVTQVS
ncbi:uncharacterized protein LOC130429511 isoform X3 [Triplophysa dalaica]|uniref:uncharacterized protein LOC130429511 isoform X3 n=1 Tax=Triplophysa dalaica TaxID=1582913 RepID=UPI0024DFD8C2|nr:uncharacterized protein LOC130429511 isoform X3 [Triplophysa dalaica]XP_056614092.1 uncharacterized protein LOC130429511 isoform X3 [Triplophysa dalaica]